jgi:hypothetical protein
LTTVPPATKSAKRQQLKLRDSSVALRAVPTESEGHAAAVNLMKIQIIEKI